jgi:hypothetical protein
MACSVEETMNKKPTYQELEERVRELEGKRLLEEREKLVDELKKTIDGSKTLRSLLPICSNCKNIRDDKGYWKQLESYITEHTGALFSHSMCPDCAKKLYPDYDMTKRNNTDYESGDE